MNAVRPIHVATAALPVLAGLAAAIALLWPAVLPSVMTVGVGLAVLGGGFAMASVLGRTVRASWLLLAASLLVSATIMDPLVRMFVRSLNVSAFDTIIPLVIAALAVLLSRSSRRGSIAAWAAALLVVAGSGGILSSSFGQVWDMATLLMWVFATFGLSFMLGLVLARVLRGDTPATPVALAAAAACLLPLAASARQYANAVVQEETIVALISSLLLVAASSVVVLIVGLIALLSPAKVARSAWLRIPVALIAFVAVIGVGAPAALPLEVPVDEAVLTAKKMRPTDMIVNASMLAEVGAQPRDEFRGKSFYDCDALNSRDCFITHYDDIALKRGVKAAVDDVIAKVKENKGATFPAHCHQVVHNLGQLAFNLATTFEEASVLDPQVCGTGYTHGLWETQFVLLGDEPLFTRTATLCEELNMTTPWYKWTCNHILGHLISTRMMDNPSLAMEYCDLITDPQALTDCLAGGWMNFFQDDRVIAEMVTRGSLLDLFSVCYGTDDSVKFLCYQELFPVIYPMVGEDDYLAAQACIKYAEPGLKEGEPWEWDVSYVDRCIQGLARAVSVSSFQDHRVNIQRCLNMPQEAHDPCLTASAASVVLNTGSTKAGFEVCREVAAEGYRVYCYFWVKHSRNMLANGPNSFNLPGKDEVRLPEAPRWSTPRSNPEQVTTQN